MAVLLEEAGVEVKLAIQAPDMADWLREYVIKPGVLDALDVAAADTWLNAEQAARHLYGSEGKAEAFRKLRERHAELDRLSQGSGKLRRWRRAELDRFVASNPRAQRRRERG